MVDVTKQQFSAFLGSLQAEPPTAAPAGKNVLAPVLVDGNPSLFTLPETDHREPAIDVLMHDGQGGYVAMPIGEVMQMYRNELGPDSGSAAWDRYYNIIERKDQEIGAGTLRAQNVPHVETGAIAVREYDERPRGPAPSYSITDITRAGQEAGKTPEQIADEIRQSMADQATRPDPTRSYQLEDRDLPAQRAAEMRAAAIAEYNSGAPERAAAAAQREAEVAARTAADAEARAAAQRQFEEEQAQRQAELAARQQAREAAVAEQRAAQAARPPSAPPQGAEALRERAESLGLSRLNPAIQGLSSANVPLEDLTPTQQVQLISMARALKDLGDPHQYDNDVLVGAISRAEALMERFGIDRGPDNQFDPSDVARRMEASENTAAAVSNVAPAAGSPNGP